MMMTFKLPEAMTLNNTEYRVRHLLEDESAHKMTRNSLLQDVYTRYVNIRTAVGGNRCAKMSLEQVKNALKTGNFDQDLQNILNLSPEKVDTVLYIAETYIPMVK